MYLSCFDFAGLYDYELTLRAYSDTPLRRGELRFALTPYKKTPQMYNKISRRKFLGQAGCAALGSATYLTSLANMELINALSRSNSSTSGDYKALVCVLLAGGCDSYNMVVPRGDSEYNDQ